VHIAASGERPDLGSPFGRTGSHHLLFKKPPAPGLTTPRPLNPGSASWVDGERQWRAATVGAAQGAQIGGAKSLHSGSQEHRPALGCERQGLNEERKIRRRLDRHPEVVVHRLPLDVEQLSQARLLCLCVLRALRVRFGVPAAGETHNDRRWSNGGPRLTVRRPAAVIMSRV
jgi:hypothetical protein